MTMINQTRRRQGGFTLIEVMIVVAIVAILAAIAYPSYLESVRKSKRAEARAQLMEAAQYMQRFYSQNDSFKRAIGATSRHDAAGHAEQPCHDKVRRTTRLASWPARGPTVLSISRPCRPGRWREIAAAHCNSTTQGFGGSRMPMTGLAPSDCWR